MAAARVGGATDANLFWMGVPIVATGAPGAHPLRFGLDTGASASSLTSGFLARVPDLSVTGSSAHVGGAGGFETLEVLEVAGPTLWIDGYEARFDELTATDEGRNELPVALDGWLESDVARDRTLVIDFLAGVLQIEEPR